jgi:RNA polymerase sigma factor (sigma-70 family)
MQVIQHLWRRRRVRIAGVLDQVAVDTPDDLAAIYRDYWELVYKRCYATLQDHEAASDATQDVFEQALTSFEAIRHDVVRGLMDLARTISYERKRRPTREVSLAELTLTGQAPARGDDNDPAEIAERHRVLHAVWSGLSPVERRYVADKFAGFSFEEIARRRGRALGTVSSNLARAHQHARKMREPLLPGILALAAWRRLTELSRRARNAAQSGSMAAAAQPVGSFTVSLTLAGLVAAAVPMATAAQTRGMRAASTPVAMALAPESAGGAGRVGATVAAVAPASTSSSAAAAPERRPGVAGGGLPLVPSGSAASETPEDTLIYTATPSPNYDQDHTIVALGTGRQCQCWALLITTDGGTTWAAQAGPPAGDQVVLSPTFPADPSIYVGYANGNGTLSNYWTPRFGRAFRPLAGLPPGAITLPAGFDRGDDRIIVATPTGIWSRDTHTGVVQPMILETAYATPSVTTSLDAPADGVMAMTTTRALAPGESASASALQSGEQLWSCPPGSPCQRVGSLPLLPGGVLLLSPSFNTDRTVIAYTGGGQFLASANGGGSFASIDLPAPRANKGDLMLGPSAAGVGLWVTVRAPSGWALMAKTTVTSPWHEADAGNPSIRGTGGHVVVVGPQRLLFLLAQGGLLCSVNGGVTWEARCPAS